MPRPTADPILTAILAGAIRATNAALGLLLAVDGRVLRVVAAAGDVPPDVIGEPISAGEGVAGYVAASGQPLVLSAESADPRLGEGTASLLGHNPMSVLAVAVQGNSRTIGVIELLDSRRGSFGVGDTEAATGHAAIAGSALSDERLGGLAEMPDPAELAAELRRLAAADPGRYARVATIIESLVR